MASKLSTELDQSVRNKIQWQNLPIHLKQVRIESLFFFISLPFFCCDSSQWEKITLITITITAVICVIRSCSWIRLRPSPGRDNNK